MHGLSFLVVRRSREVRDPLHTNNIEGRKGKERKGEGEKGEKKKKRTEKGT